MSITLEDIAREAGVSVVTVSRVLNGSYPEKVSEKTRQKVLDTVRRLNYKPNIMARGLQKRRTHLIGVVVDRIGVSFFGDILQGVQDAAIEADLGVIVYTRHNPICDDECALRELLSRRVDGIVYAPPVDGVEHALSAVEEGMPMVQLANYHSRLQIPYVAVDHYQGAYRATEHLIKLGHKRIAHLGILGSSDLQGLNRLLGYKMALQDYGLSVDEQLVVSADYDWEWGYKAAAELLRRTRDFSAIFACSDFTAVGAMRYLEEQGLQIPNDVAIVGFDDLPFSQWLSAPLTTVAQPKEEIGRAAVSAIVQLIEGKEVSNTVFQPELIIRRSCGGGRAAR